MDFMNCPRCGKIFNRLSSPVCEDCEREDEAQFKRVKAYIDENPHSRVADITKAVGVSVKAIMRYLREGRLEVNEGMAQVLRCEKCNKPILRGHYCDACLIGMKQEVTGMFTAQQPSRPGKKTDTRTGVKMHTFDGIQASRTNRNER